MTIEKLNKLRELFNCLEKWEEANLSLEEATESDMLDISSHIQAVEEGRLRLILAWKELKFELQKEKENAETA